MRKLPTTLNLEDMRSMVSHFAEMLTLLTIAPDVLESAREFNEQGIEGLCFSGMGGSAIAGDYVKEVLIHRAPKPICIIRDYSIPRYMAKDWAIIAVSYSGNTEETLSAVKQADERGSKILTITTGGQMKEKYSHHPQILIQKGLQPRAAFPLLFSAALHISETLIGLESTNLDGISKNLTIAAERWGEWISTPSAMAGNMSNKIPLFIGAQHMVPVAYRAKCQVNENSKRLAFSSEIPEATHNVVEGFPTNHQGHVVPVFLRYTNEGIRVKQQLDVMDELCKELELNPITLKAAGESNIENMLTLTHYLDMLSVELGEMQGVDVASVERITELKRRMAARN